MGWARWAPVILSASVIAGCQNLALLKGPSDSVVAENSASGKAARRAKSTASATQPAGAASEKTGSLSFAKSDAPLRGSIAPSAPPGIDLPVQTLFGNWTLGEANGARKCRMILGGALVASGYSARSDGGCSESFSAVHSWEVQGDEIVLRNQSRSIIGRLNPTGPARFDGQGPNGTPIYLIR